MALFTRSTTRRKAAAAASIAAVAALALSACGGGGGGGSTAAGPSDVAKDVNISGSPTFDKIKKDGKMIIGVKEDQPGLGYLDAATGERSGFDIQIAQWMAASLGVAADKIEYKVVDSANREQALSNGDVDMYVGTYSITDKRKTMVGFAGPYFLTGQGLLVKKGSGITSIDDMKGKTVCSATGSTPLQNITDNYKDVKAVGMDKYSNCVAALDSGTVQGVTTDEAILIGFASQSPDKYEVVGKPFTTEKYGIGLKKGDTALCTALDKTLTDGKDTWTKIYDDTLGKSGTKVEQPAVEPCA